MDDIITDSIIEENISTNNSVIDDNIILPDTENSANLHQLETLLEVTFTKDEVEDFYAKFPSDPLTAIFAA